MYEPLLSSVSVKSRPANRRLIGGLATAALSLASGFLWLVTLRAQPALGETGATWIEPGKGVLPPT